MQVVNDKTRQEASAAGRRFGRMTCGRCVALHPTFTPRPCAIEVLDGRTASSDPLFAMMEGFETAGCEPQRKDRNFAKLPWRTCTLWVTETGLDSRLRPMSSGPVTGGSCGVTDQAAGCLQNETGGRRTLLPVKHTVKSGNSPWAHNRNPLQH